MKTTTSAAAMQPEEEKPPQTIWPAGKTYAKGRKIAFETMKEKIQSLKKGFGDADYGPVIEISPTLIKQHAINRKYFDEGSTENYGILSAAIEKSGLQTVLGVIKIGKVIYSIDGTRRAQIACQLGIPKVKVRFARKKNMTYKELEHAIIFANASRDMPAKDKLRLINTAFPDVKRQIEKKFETTAETGKPTYPSHGDVSPKDIVEKGIATTEKEAQKLLEVMKRSIQREFRGKKLLTLGDKVVNEKMLLRFQNSVNNAVDNYISGQNALTIKAAEKYMASKSKNIFAKPKKIKK